MKKRSLFLSYLMCLGLLGQGIPYGKEFPVSTYTYGDQGIPTIATLSDGRFVVCWESRFQDNFISNIYGQIFDSCGLKESSEFQVNTTTKDNHYGPVIAGLSGGGFMVCWERWGQNGYSNIYCQLFDSEGSKPGKEFLVNTSTDYEQCEPVVTTLSDSGFVVCWESRYQNDDSEAGIYGQMFDAGGSKKGSEFHVNTTTLYDQTKPAVTGLPHGGFVVCWESREQNDDSDGGIYGQMFDAGGSKKGSEFHVNTTTLDDQTKPAVTGLPHGGFVVCWQSWEQDGSCWGIFSQMYSIDGLKKGCEFQVNTNTDYSQNEPAIAYVSNRGFVVCWDDDREGKGIYAKRFLETPISNQLISFNLLEPPIDAMLQNTSVKLKWQQPSDQIVCFPWELHYRILIDESPDFTSPRVVEQDMDTTVTLQGLVPGTTYFWKVLAKNIDGDSLWSSNTNAFFVSHTTAVDEEVASPEDFLLYPNHPNPFNSETVIRFELSDPGFVHMAVYDMRGRLIRILLDENKTAGAYSIKWDGKDMQGSNMPSGIYICKIEVRTPDGRNVSKSMKMGLVR